MRRLCCVFSYAEPESWEGDYALVGPRPLKVQLAREVGAAILNVRVSGESDDRELEVQVKMLREACATSVTSASQASMRECAPV